ncbi:hypothetical protein CJJ07_003868 [Candidozyma auris]|nr:hypothetical protein CJJ07_003868 [[Candida] auris]QEL60744.1 hypothetical protein CJJ09_002862 [[Candida] auris]
MSSTTPRIPENASGNVASGNSRFGSPTTHSLYSHPSNANLSHLDSAEGTSMSKSDSKSYDEQINNISSGGNIDLKTVNKHLVPHEDTLKMQGGDVARYMYHQLENASKGEVGDKRRTRSSSFSNFEADSRRESMASDINVPGGFRREFLINRSLQRNSTPPNFLTRNFVEFLSIYGHFAGEDFSDDEGEDETDDEAASVSFPEVFDEESSLLAERRIPPPPKHRKKKSKSEKKGTASSAKTFFLVFKALVGSGILFLPGAFSNGGLLFSTVTLTGFGVLTFLCYIVLIQSKQMFHKSSFGELGYITYGKPLKYSIMVSIIISQIGFVATYVLFTAENMTSFLENVAHVHVEKSTVVIVQCLLLIPLVLIRDLTKLSFTSLISSTFIVIGLVIIFYFSGNQLATEGLGPNIVQFDSKNWSMMIGVAVTSFEGIGLILPIQSSMARPEKFPTVLAVSMLVITTLFVSVGVIGYSAFGEKVKSIIILNLPQGNLSVQSILVLYSVAVFLTGPLQLFPAIKIGESVIFNSRLFLSEEQRRSYSDEGKLYHTSGKYNPHIKWLKNVFRALAVVLISVISYLNAENIEKFVSFNGCFACIPLVYIYPPMIHLKTFTDKPPTLKNKLIKTFDWSLIVVGIVVVIYTTRQILFAI